jgi:NAD(P)-dependent dehydrogenase (short-subunit alcohol dehydrogenase family)
MGVEGSDQWAVVEEFEIMKTFLSIGSGPGMGLATAERFAEESFQVVLSARNAAKTQELADQLKAKGYKVIHGLGITGFVTTDRTGGAITTGTRESITIGMTSQQTAAGLLFEQRPAEADAL